jgi:fengycin family lipopeptide synthetase B
LTLAGKGAVITGAGRGIGRAIALAFARSGATLALTALEADDLNSVGAEVQQLGQQAFTFPADISDEAQVEAFLEYAFNHLPHVDVLVNNAGTLLLPADFLSTTPDMWDRTMAVNVRSTYLMTYQLVPYMIRRNFGRIINIASRAGLRGIPERAAYCASKHAVVGLTRALALDFRGHNINVNTICPGAVITPLTDVTRPNADRNGWLKPNDIANLALYLASAEADAITGAIIEVDDRS